MAPPARRARAGTVSSTHLRAHESPERLVCGLLRVKKKECGREDARVVSLAWFYERVQMTRRVLVDERDVTVNAENMIVHHSP